MQEQHNIIKSRDENFAPVFNYMKETNDFINTIKLINAKVKRTLLNLDNYFVPACVSHMILTRNDWNSFNVNDVYLEDSIYNWINHSSDLNNFKLFENCTWPNCNKKCPILKHPDTNQSINPIEYFSYFGLINFKSLSQRLKINEKNLKKTSYNKIMKLLFSK